MTPTLHITRGLPGSGKTTFAREWVAEAPATRVRVNRDDLRAMMYDRASSLDFHQEELVTTAQRALAKAALAEGKDVIADDMNLRPRYVREWRKFAKANGAEFEIHEMDTTVDQCVARDAERIDRWGVGVGRDVIWSLASRFKPKGKYLPVPEETEPKPSLLEPYAVPLGAPTAIIVDIDGTVALNTGGRGWYDYDRVGEDTSNHDVVQIVEALRERVDKVVFLSGRSEDCREVTQQWLGEHVGATGPLFMRPSGDMRRDSIVKAELFNEHVRHKYDVRAVLDDRQQVVDMWRELGLTCLQVAPGDF